MSHNQQCDRFQIHRVKHHLGVAIRQSFSRFSHHQKPLDLEIADHGSGKRRIQNTLHQFQRNILPRNSRTENRACTSSENSMRTPPKSDPVKSNQNPPERNKMYPEGPQSLDSIRSLCYHK